MQEIAEIVELAAARTALHPTRVELLQRLHAPHTCAELAQALQHSPQHVNNHLKELLRVGLIRVVKRRRKKNLMESTYQAVAKAYWLSPKLVRPPAAEARDRLALHHLLDTAESIGSDVAALLGRAGEEEVPSLGFSVDVHLADEAARKAFASEMLEALRPVVERWQSRESERGAYKLRVVCYPTPQEPKRNER